MVKEIVVKPLSQAKHWALKALGIAMIGCIKVYQYTISPLLGPRCRFWPSCSSYTVEAIQVHGPFKGGWMAIKRILRCHPGSAGGIDPVPGGRSEQLCREDPDLTAPPHSECNHKCDHQH